MTFSAPAYCMSVRQGQFGPKTEGLVLFEAKVRELPDACSYAETEAEARHLMADVIATTARIFVGQGRPMPAALPPETGWPA